jgi:nucleosome binding factor SPN SPT16 subunit
MLFPTSVRNIHNTGWRPIQEQEATYNLLLTLQSELLTTMKDGSTARDAYQHALSVVRDKKPELEKHFVKNIGFGVGYDSGLELHLLTGDFASISTDWNGIP